MKGIPFLLIALVIIAGCTSPAKVASGMPAVIKNVSNEIGNVTGEIERNLSYSVMGTATITPEQSRGIKIVRV